MIYLDYAASSPLRPEVLKTLIASEERDFANPSAIHQLGSKQKKEIEKIRQKFIQSFCQGTPTEEDYFLFTSSATESNTTVIQGLNLSEGDEAFYSEADHPSLVQNVLHLINKGVQVRSCPLKENGQVDLDWLKDNIGENTKLLALTHVNNHNGSIQPLDQIGSILREKAPKCHFHVDAVQSYGLFPIEVHQNHIHSVSIGGHKISAPKGIAGLYLHKIDSIQPLLIGGGHQEGVRSSTEVTPLVKAMDKARELSTTDQLEQYKQWNKFLREELQKIGDRIVFPFSLDETSPRILSVIIKGVSSDILMRHLEQEEIYISSSSACSSRIKGDNSVFKALNIPVEHHKSVLRISFGWGNSTEQLSKFVMAFKEVLEDLDFLISK